MQTTTTAFGVIATSNEATVLARVTITWPAAVSASYQTLSETVVESLSLTKQTQTDQPDGSRYLTGKAAASCDLVLAGTLDPTDDTKTIAWLMGQYSTGSPMFRLSGLSLSVNVDLGFLTGDATMVTPNFEGVEFVRAITGFTDDYTVNDLDGTVSMTVLDGRTKFGSVPDLPAIDTSSRFTATLTSEFPIDTLARQAGYFTWPATRSNAVLAVGMRGSVVPEVGSVNVAASSVDLTAVAPILVPGKYGTAAILDSFFYDLSRQISTDDLVIEMIVDFAFGNGVFIFADEFGDTAFVAFGWNGTTVSFQVQNLVTSQISTWVGTLPTSGSHYIGCQLHGTALTIRVDGASQTFTTIARDFQTYQRAHVGNSAGSIEAVQISTEPTGALFNDGFVPNAVINPSLNLLTALPDVAGNDSWNVLQDIAEAEFGVVGLDELDTFFFKNRTTLQGSASVRTVTRAQSIASTSVQSTRAAAGINHVQIPVNKLQVGLPTFVWTAPDVISVPPRGSFSQLITMSGPVVGVPANDSGEAPGGGGTPGSTYWRAARTAAGATRVATGVRITCEQLSPSVVNMTIYNANGFTIYMTTPSGVGFPSTSVGLGAINIGGRFVTSGVAIDGTTTTNSSVTADAFYDDGKRESLMSLQANAWRQRVDVATDQASALLKEFNVDKPMFTDLTMFLDPRLQRGDRITAEVADGVFEDLIIQDIKPDAANWLMQVSARAVFAPGSWLLGVVGRSELGVTTYV